MPEENKIISIDPAREIGLMAAALRAGLETERWFGVSQLPRAKMENPRAASSKTLAEKSARSTPSEGAAQSHKSKAEMLDELAESISQCAICRISGERKNLVFGEGNPDARLMFIGEAPGHDEDVQGRPFVGRAGQLLTKIITAMGLNREDVYIANILKCRPPGNRTPNIEEIAACVGTVIRQIEIIQPEIIIALGAVAAGALLEAKGSLASMRGKFHDFRGIKALVTYHPAYLLRNPDAKRMVWQDVQRAMDELGLKSPQGRRNE